MLNPKRVCTYRGEEFYYRYSHNEIFSTVQVWRKSDGVGPALTTTQRGNIKLARRMLMRGYLTPDKKGCTKTKS